MPSELPEELTIVLNKAAKGDSLAADRVWCSIYADLRDVVSQSLGAPRIGERHVPGATTIVEQAFLNLQSASKVNGNPWKDRKSFFVAIAKELARFLISYRTSNPANSRGGFARVLPLGLDFDRIATFDEALVATDCGVFESLRMLEADHPVAADAVWLRYVCGLTIDQTAELLGVKPRTVCKHWNYAKAWIRRDLDKGYGDKGYGRSLPEAI